MKLNSSMVLAILLASAVGALAADKSNEKPTDTKQTKVTKAEKAPAKAKKQPKQVALTGSYIKKDIHQNGLVTDGANPVFVLNEDMIRNSGATDVRELLVLRGLSH
jgi:hypothetical protein